MLRRCAVRAFPVVDPYRAFMQTEEWHAPEPVDAWLTLLGAAAPFQERLLCLTSEARGHGCRRDAAARAARFSGFRFVDEAPVPPSLAPFPAARSAAPPGSASKRASEAGAPLVAAAPRPDEAVVAAAAGNASPSPAVAALSLLLHGHAPVFPVSADGSVVAADDDSGAGGVAAQRSADSARYDCVAFAPGAFPLPSAATSNAGGVDASGSAAVSSATEQADQQRRVLASCKALLRPHGICAVVTAGGPLRLVANPAVERDFGDVCAFLRSFEAPADAAAAASQASGLADVAFPWPLVERHWFTAEYAVSPAALGGFLRGLPGYRRCVAPSQRTDAASGGVSWRGGAGSVDPVDAFVDIAGAYAAAAAASAGARADRTVGGAARAAQLRVAQDWCVVLCHQRPVPQRQRWVPTGPGVNHGARRAGAAIPRGS